MVYNANQKQPWCLIQYPPWLGIIPYITYGVAPFPNSPVNIQTFSCRKTFLHFVSFPFMTATAAL